MSSQEELKYLTPYQKQVIAILALLQFTIVVDFMVMSPLGDMLIKALEIKPPEFGLVVSAYAFSAGLAGIATAGFADKFDRKKLLIFFYVGFIIGTFLCGIANTYRTLLMARIVTGLFGGVVGSISLAIVTDLFTLNQRGRVMAFIQMAFAASQVLGIPLSIVVANAWGWNAPFLAIVVFAFLLLLFLIFKLKPVDEHLKLKNERSAILHFWKTLTNKTYLVGFISTALISIGGFMLMPFASAFAINNLGVTQDQLPLIFLFSGITSAAIMPMVGRLSDRFDKFKIFLFGSVWAIIMVLVYTSLGPTPLWIVIALNMLLFVGMLPRMVPATALVSAVPEAKDRGAFMSVNSSLQQVAGGVASIIAGLIVFQETTISPIEHFDTLGIIVAVIMVICIGLIYKVNKIVRRKEAN